MNEQEQKTELLPESAEQPPKKEKNPKLKQLIQILKFTGFSISAGVIQFVTTGALSTWTSLIPYWIAYLTGLVLSVVWNFTFNRKFTFAAANNIPLAMGLVIVYYCAFTPVSTFGADAIVEAWERAAGEAWNSDYELVITASMMILNFVTEFVWDKFIVFNDKVTSKIERLFKKKTNAEEPATDVIPVDVTCEPLAEEALPERLLLEENTPLSPENELEEETENTEDKKDGA